MLSCFGMHLTLSAELEPAPAIHLHSHAALRFFKLPLHFLLAANEGIPGLPVCIAATHLDGLVLALTPLNHSCDYWTTVVHGYGSLVTDPLERRADTGKCNVVPERWEKSHVPPTEAEVKATSVLKVEVASVSAKIREYTAGNDSDKVDLDDDEAVGKVRTGVVPKWVQ